MKQAVHLPRVSPHRQADQRVLLMTWTTISRSENPLLGMRKTGECRFLYLGLDVGG
jgi:hypothetical protein